MTLNKAFIPISALTLALGVGGSVAEGAQRDGQDRGGRQNQNQGQARQRSHSRSDQDQRSSQDQQNSAREQRGNDQASRSNNQASRGHDQAARGNAQASRGNGQAFRDDGRRNQSSGRVEPRSDQGWNQRDDRRGSNAFRSYGNDRPRYDVRRPSFNRHYGPGFGVFFGVGSGYRYGSPYNGRVYGYVPSFGYSARVYYGDVRLQVRPRDAAVFVDGYYAGIVDDFDGVFQRLTLTVGPHEIEIAAPGLEPQVYNVYVDPSRTVDVRADLY